jgi:hypothetical protein
MYIYDPPKYKAPPVNFVTIIAGFQTKLVQWHIIIFYKLCNFSCRNLAMVGEFEDYKRIARHNLDKD